MFQILVQRDLTLFGQRGEGADFAPVCFSNNSFLLRDMVMTLTELLCLSTRHTHAKCLVP